MFDCLMVKIGNFYLLTFQESLKLICIKEDSQFVMLNPLVPIL